MSSKMKAMDHWKMFVRIHGDSFPIRGVIVQWFPFQVTIWPSDNRQETPLFDETIYEMLNDTDNK